MTDQEAVKEMFNALSTAYIAVGIGFSFLGLATRLAARWLL